MIFPFFSCPSTIISSLLIHAPLYLSLFISSPLFSSFILVPSLHLFPQSPASPPYSSVNMEECYFPRRRFNRAQWSRKKCHSAPVSEGLEGEEEEAHAQRAARTDPAGCRRQKPLNPCDISAQTSHQSLQAAVLPRKKEGWDVCERLKKMKAWGRAGRQAGRQTGRGRQR